MDFVFAWILGVGTPLSILAFLTSFLVWMGQGRHDVWFTRLCNRMMVPSVIAWPASDTAVLLTVTSDAANPVLRLPLPANLR